MTKKPAGRQYRNLTAYRGTIWYKRTIGGKEIRFDLETTSWKEAAEARDYYERRKGIERKRSHIPRRSVPTLAEFVPVYLEEATSHLSPSTLGDRPSYLKREGPLLSRLGHLPLHRITADVLDAWWTEIIVKGESDPKTDGVKRRTPQTGTHYLNVLSTVLRHAMKPRYRYVESNPVDAFREMRRDENRGKKRRTASSSKAQPIESRDDIGALLDSAHEEGLETFSYVLCHLDAGLRTGEVLGLCWGDVAQGREPDYRGRHLFIRRNRPRGGEEDKPKSGSERKVALSLRLRAVLDALYRERFQPGPDVRVFAGVDPSNFRKREWRRILRRAGLAHIPIKSLRDTYASQLLSVGVQVSYISRQLGHGDVGVTAGHYATWTGGDEYVQPMPTEPHEVPADLLSRIAPGTKSGTKSAHGRQTAFPRDSQPIGSV